MSYSKSDDISKHVLISLLLHASVILVMTVKAILLPNDSFEYIPAMRVDLVALPDKLSPTVTDSKTNQPPPKVDEKKLPPKEEPPPAKVEAPKNAEAKIPDGPTVALKKEEKKTKTEKADSAIAKIRESMAVEKIKQMMKNSNESQAQAEQATYKGNVLSPGTELTGINKLQHENYHGDLDHHVKKFWALPEWLANKPLTAQVRIYLDEKGLLINAKIIKSSGLKDYDEKVLESLKNASPYPPPPPKFKDIVSVQGILLGFPE